MIKREKHIYSVRKVEKQMTYTIRFNLLICFAVLLACSPPNKNESASQAVEEKAEKLKPISELTYIEVWEILLKANNARGMDVHGDPYGNEAIGQLNITDLGSCEQANCGTGKMLINSSDRHVQTVVRFAFSLPGNPLKEMQRAYKIEPNGQTNLGCSHFCYDDQQYVVDISITSAGYFQAPEADQ